MRTTKFLAAFAAVLALFSGCRQDEDYVLPSLEVGTETVEFTSGSQMTVELMATRDWMVKSVPEWAAVDPDHGSASSAPQRVNISVLPNESYDRTGTLLLTIGLKPDASVTLFQPGAKGPKSEGTGTLEDPYTVSGVLSYIGTLGADVESPQDVYIKGKVASVSEFYSAQYGNASFVIKDEDGAETFTVYRAKYLGNRNWKTGDTQIAENDEVVVCGRVVNYRGNTPETAANKAFLYSLNGNSEGGGSGGGEGTPSGSGTQSDPYNVAAARAAVANLTWTSNDDYQTTEEVYVKGKISKIADKGTFGESGTYGNASFYIVDEGADAEFYMFRILYLGNKKYTSGDDIKIGDEVVVCGKLMNYRGNTPESVAGKAYLYSLNGKSEGGSSGGGGGESGEASGTGTQSDPYNVAAARAAVANLTWTSTTEYESTDDVYVKGKISKIADKGTFGESGNYGNATFYISDDGKTNNELEAYRILYFGNKKYESGTDIKVGDDVVICGKLMNYRGNTPETVAGKAYLYSLNGNSEGGSSGGNEGGGNEGGETSEVKKVSVADFIAASPSETQKYQLTGKVSGTVNTQYGNFDLVDETGTVYVYGLTKTELGYGKKNDQSFESLGIKAGDTVTLIGYRGDYNGKVEVMYAYYVSHSSGGGNEGGGNEGGGQGGDQQGNGSGTLADPYTPVGATAVASALASGAKTDKDVYVKGKISRIAVSNNVEQFFTEQYGNATFYISADGSKTDEFYVFRTLYLGNRNWKEGDTQIKVGDEVIICGKLTNYQGKTPETAQKESYIYSLNGKTE